MKIVDKFAVLIFIADAFKKHIAWVLVAAAFIAAFASAAIAVSEQNKRRAELVQQFKDACKLTGGYTVYDGQKRVCLK